MGDTDFDFALRLRDLIGSQSVRSFAKSTGLGVSTVQKYLDGAVPGLDKVIQISRATGTSVAWLASSDGPKFAGQPATAAENLSVGDDPDAFTLVPRLGVEASAGHGLVALAEEVTERLAFKTDWLRDMGLSPAFVGLVTCRGDSQDPVIKDGALMLVDMRPDQVIRSGCFYVIVLEGDVLVKLINRRTDGTIELISHNPAYPKETIDNQRLDKLTIPGRVVWAGQKL